MKLSLYMFGLLCVMFSLNGISIANRCFSVGNCPYFERFCSNSPFGSPEQDPVTYGVIPCVLWQSEHSVIKASRERD